MQKTQKILNISQRMKDLYVTYRGVWIQQNDDGSYHTEKRYKFHDDRITDHLLQKRTVGLTVNDVTKFITFDIDYGKRDMKLARGAVHKIVDELINNHNINLENILVSFSGSKGYHLEIFFDRPIKVNIARNWHHKVVQAINEDISKIEFRPSHQGIKLPLGVHKVTGKRCHLVHSLTLDEIPDDHIFNIVQLDGLGFQDDALAWLNQEDKDKVVYLPKDKADELVEVLDITKLDIPVDYEERCQMMLEENQLLYPDSRHLSTLLLLVFLAQTGYEEEEAVGIVQNIISNTFKVARQLIDDKTTEEKALSEVARLWKYAVTYNLGQKASKIVQVYENEILEVLEPKQIHLKQLLFILLIHSKKHHKNDGVFYMTYQQMTKMGATSERGRLLKYLMELEKMGLIEVVERNRRQKNGLHHLPNRYKVNIVPNTERHIELNTAETQEVKLEKVVAHLIKEDTAKEMIAKKQFYEKFKPYYKALAV